MRIAVTGSIATDHLMTFPGRFAEQLLPEQLDSVSLSFLADTLEVRRGGTGANIAYGLALLGRSPVLVGAVGPDFAADRERLEALGVDTSHLWVSAHHQTARFVSTTDLDQNQIATFYPGAMAEAGKIDLRRIAASGGGLDLVLIAPDDPKAMVRHTTVCVQTRLPFAADPSQQLARLDRQEARALLAGPRYLFTNEYEASLLLERTGWSEREVLDRVGTWVTTLGAAGVRLRAAGRPDVLVSALPSTAVAEPPVCVGDAFRAGFLAALAGGADEETAARHGCALAVIALESVGGQEYHAGPAELRRRVFQGYGEVISGRDEPVREPSHKQKRVPGR
uniref:Putative carbohydrate kinase n=1 Tax=Streptomyces sp. 2238-SVT4 TaxID=681626 RepID=D5MRK4_9ACTN|nr:putative carbohydrate kinase [Streptomyces sp. 2238-SVT4]